MLKLTDGKKAIEGEVLKPSDYGKVPPRKHYWAGVDYAYHEYDASAPEHPNCKCDAGPVFAAAEGHINCGYVGSRRDPLQPVMNEYIDARQATGRATNDMQEDHMADAIKYSMYSGQRGVGKTEMLRMLMEQYRRTMYVGGMKGI
jgi:hypothetical protein